VTLNVDKHSTPYREGQDVNGERQPFMATPKLNTVLTGWGKAWNTWGIGFQSPSLPASADGKTKNQWVAIPTWLFTADFEDDGSQARHRGLAYRQGHAGPRHRAGELPGHVRGPAVELDRAPGA